MRIEFIPKTHGKILAIEPLSAKRGQTDLVPAVAITLGFSLPTDKLAVLDPTLKDFLFRSGEKAQGELEKTLVLTDAAKAIGGFGWDGEQTGTQLNVYYGISGDMNQVLKEGTVDKVKVSPKDGGFDLQLRFYSEKDIDEEVLGGLGVLKNHEVDIELVPPVIEDKQPDLADQGGGAPAGTKAKRSPRQTPANALAATLGHDAIE